MKIWYSSVYNKYDMGATTLPLRVPVLVSYATLGAQCVIPEVASELFLDSGAFSAKTQGKALNVDEYCKYVHDRKGMFETVASLDVIGDPAKSWDNYLAMISNGINPMPAFHIGSDLKWLKLYTEKTNYIALGGIAKVTKKPRFQFLNQVFSAFPNSDEIGFHGFGVTGVSMMQEYPWKTVDSSSAMVAARTGDIICPYGQMNLAQESAFHSSPASQNKVRDYVESLELGLDWGLMNSATTAGTCQRFYASVMFFESIKDNHPTVYTPHMVGFL